MSFQVSSPTEGNRETFQILGNQPGNQKETVSLKTLALKVIQGNRQGNFQETQVFEKGNSEDKVSSEGNSTARIYHAPSALPEELRQAYKERAAIMELDGGLSRHQADKYAWCREICMLTIGQSELCEQSKPCPRYTRNIDALTTTKTPVTFTGGNTCHADVL
jgi:hypothetical protein